MKRIFAVTCLLAVVFAYYVYTPLPSTISDPWKLMLLDAAFRGVMGLGNLVHGLGLIHHVRVLNFAVNQFELQGPWSSEAVRVRDTSFSGVQVRLFEPTQGESGQLKRAVVYLHGGGWALGSARMRSYDFLCRRMAEELNAVIVSVDYRLAPDAHFPQQYDDALLAARHFLNPEVLARFSVDPDRVAVSGDSAGGNLAAAVAQQVSVDSSASVRFKLQALIYPVLQALDFNTPSYQQNRDVPILYRPLMARFWLEYLDGDPSFVQPMLANNHSALDLTRAAAGREKLNWTRLLPPAFKRGYRPVAPARGTARIIEEVPALLDARAAPLLAEREVLGHSPRAYVLTCEHDVLRDDGAMYARRLQEAGVPVTHDHYADGFHGCMIFAFWPTYFSVGERTVAGYIRWLDQNL
ncbi:neutral cholesterol ester hydrolase 1-like isoform X1 [Megalops cyprinoides]|uniref:neutral cholesterol ester hydrolase 1-like isoform X1 n=1 Tax=Megalops cyprinoides TaxID=118141 RepID=UPI001863CC69|nr:neutral cholesterol ester hydrolase 1-like isoform X1 [Megalops cyprinoides]